MCDICPVGLFLSFTRAMTLNAVAECRPLERQYVSTRKPYAPRCTVYPICRTKRQICSGFSVSRRSQSLMLKRVCEAGRIGSFRLPETRDTVELIPRRRITPDETLCKGRVFPLSDPAEADQTDGETFSERKTATTKRHKKC